MKNRILAAAQNKRAPTRTAVTRDTALLLLTAALLAVNVLLAAGGVAVGHRPMELVIITGLGRGTIALAATWAACARGGSMLGRSRTWLIATTLATPLAIVGWMLLAARGAPTGEALGHWHCLATAMLFGLPPLVAFVVVHHQSGVSFPIATGSALGAAAGSWADFLMVLHCPSADLAHRLVCHVGPTAVLVSIGALLGAFVIRTQVRSGYFGTDRSSVPRFTDGG